ncbi:P pilus assembly protein, chaperone PapD [Fischerella thermalis CCMEE 5268]|uniref:P pilus assembly protein, chaperone PapD n=1 Tax=Fischerella thermalis CCMEE 5268 TaxID=2019662 RepID=A0A2N6KJF5_9CYAN|nr:fimbria/pilus periplasmic chaperone [Fischerella thermalis]PLZ99746.1 P pilus assembly protein, chaperone PapD [Fischerella thermalis CCMEE 5268]
MLRKVTTLALTAIGALTLGIPAAIAALDIGVSPSRVEVQINRKTRTQSIRVLNLSSKPLELKAYTRTWNMNEDGKLEDIASTEESLDRWIIFTPSQFTIPPKSSQTIRFAIRPRVQLKPGEHRAVLYLEEVRPSNEEQTKAIRTIGRFGVVIYGYVGDITRVGVLNSITVDTKPKVPTAVFDVSSTGSGYVRLKGQYAVWSAAKYPGAKATQGINDLGKPGKKLPENIIYAGMLPISPVLPGTRRRLLLPIVKNLPPGNYVLDLNGELNGIKIDQGIPFTVTKQTNTQKPQSRNRSTTSPSNQNIPLRNR